LARLLDPAMKCPEHLAQQFLLRGPARAEPSVLKPRVPDLDAFKVVAIKSRVHFRRGFHDNGFANTILLVEPSEPFLGTTRLDALPYRNVDLTQFYPYGNPAFPA
jgi:hypothetical protein